MFNTNSGLVKTWVSLIRKGIYTTDDIPNIGNLREVVISVLGEGVGT
ncbi:MAG: hypothetical protein WHF31_16395 [Candidatus Dehalobacter alkaniphilus]